MPVLKACSYSLYIETARQKILSCTISELTLQLHLFKYLTWLKEKRKRPKATRTLTAKEEEEDEDEDEDEDEADLRR